MAVRFGSLGSVGMVPEAGARAGFDANETGGNASWTGVKLAIGTRNAAQGPGHLFL